MPTLSWIGKEAVENHHNEIPYKLLKCDSDLSFGDNESGNLIVQGDNLEALKALLPYYAGKVKCIYIDPPYNTGNEGWAYNDNVSSPEIKDWLTKVVGKEGEDLSRHDKWLCMMYPRLQLLHKFLSPNGLIFISIDDNEYQNLKHICDEIFGLTNFITNFTWKTEGNFDNQAKIKINHEYILCYSKRIGLFEIPKVVDPNISDKSKLFKNEVRNTIVKNGPKNPISKVILPTGFPSELDNGIIKSRSNRWPNYETDAIIENHRLTNEVEIKSGWSSKEIFLKFIKNKFNPVKDSKGQNTTFLISKTGAIEALKKREDASHVVSSLQNLGSTQNMSSELNKMGFKFSYPKSLSLIKYLLKIISGNNFIVLDSFAGSGTTAHAVLKLNKEDGGNRKFILVEMEEKICNEVTSERMRRVINGYEIKKSKGEVEKVEGLGGGFRYCKLGDTLFDEFGNIKKEVSFRDLAHHVFFSETGAALSSMDSFFQKKNRGKENCSLIGVYKGIAYYLLFNGVMGDKSADGGNILTNKTIEKLPKYNGDKIIFGEGCRVSQSRLKRERITFKQLPYEIKTS